MGKPGEVQEHFDLWAFAREGLVRGSDGKEDALVVAAWTHGMPYPVVFTHRFLPKGKGGFSLLGPMMVQGLSPNRIRPGRNLLHEGC